MINIETATPLTENTDEVLSIIDGMTKAELVAEAERLEQILDSCTEKDLIWKNGIYDELEERIEYIEETLKNL